MTIGHSQRVWVIQHPSLSLSLSKALNSTDITVHIRMRSKNNKFSQLHCLQNASMAATLLQIHRINDIYSVCVCEGVVHWRGCSVWNWNGQLTHQGPADITQYTFTRIFTYLLSRRLCLYNESCRASAPDTMVSFVLKSNVIVAITIVKC